MDVSEEFEKKMLTIKKLKVDIIRSMMDDTSVLILVLFKQQIMFYKHLVVCYHLS